MFSWWGPNKCRPTAKVISANNLYNANGPSDFACPMRIHMPQELICGNKFGGMLLAFHAPCCVWPADTVTCRNLESFWHPLTIVRVRISHSSAFKGMQNSIVICIAASHVDFHACSRQHELHQVDFMRGIMAPMKFVGRLLYERAPCSANAKIMSCFLPLILLVPPKQCCVWPIHAI